MPTPVRGMHHLKYLNRDGGALGRALTDPGFEFARCDRRSWFQLHIAHRQFAGIGVGLPDDGGKTDLQDVETRFLLWGRDRCYARRGSPGP